MITLHFFFFKKSGNIHQLGVSFFPGGGAGAVRDYSNKQLILKLRLDEFIYVNDVDVVIDELIILLCDNVDNECEQLQHNE